ncbi:cell division protein ZapE [Acidisphaera rubrifaciens]|uniref:Chaperone of cytochrome c oxidases n=1 Tax=Acidisphaera rubrifaciens HS-AP3 TaxID=1231350 RepID=A0A0D6P4F8_9PROT|nr:cell division protein ZapE [Acidisphaera rubrifaciens]GAN76093.1 chaperone of cytochrome c oxidases [Acidisphaera rubrifaciens HS-AP3]
MKIDTPPAALRDGPLPAYRARLRAGELAADPAQALAAERLQLLWAKLHQYDPSPGPQAEGGSFLARLLGRRRVEEQQDYPNGLYLVGDVGRGKSMLMDMFFAAADVPRKRRVHFHAFMQDVHARIHAARREAPSGFDPVPPLADGLAAEAALLCFDEFQVTDVADAMILGRLFEALFARGVVVVATSNTAPDHLFEGQPGRDAFLPFIALIKRHLEVLVLEGGRDWRRSRLRDRTTWHVPADARATEALDAAFEALAGGAAAHPERLRVSGRTLTVPLAAEGVARFDFAALCGQPLGPGDYLAIATHYHALVLDGVPRLGPDTHDEARRFITLVDALYEHRVKLIASADAAPDMLYREGDGAEAFRRTASRIEEMQSADWQHLAHLT